MSSTRWPAISQRVTSGNNGVPIFSLHAVPGCTQLITMPQPFPVCCTLASVSWTQRDHRRSSPGHSGTTGGPHLDTAGPLAILTWTHRDHRRSSPAHSGTTGGPHPLLLPCDAAIQCSPSHSSVGSWVVAWLGIQGFELCGVGLP